MAMFVTIPFALIKTAGLDKAHHWEVYLPVTVIGFLLMVPAIIYGEKKAKLKQVFIGAIAIMTAAQLGMALALDSFWQIVVWLGLYFIAFNILEATLPSLISKSPQPMPKEPPSVCIIRPSLLACSWVPLPAAGCTPITARPACSALPAC
jgi:hypothetical protein